MATWYVDSSATGTHNGTSWANAWTAFSQIAGVAAGDTVYISGGASGSTKTYNFSGNWGPTSGSATAKITYQVGQDSTHNGTAILNLNGHSLVSGPVQHVVISGNAGDGAQHFQVNGAARLVDASGSTDLRVSYLNVPNSTGMLAYLNGGTQIEIDHCSFFKVAGSSSDDDAAIYFGVNGPAGTWDTNKIHDCVFNCPHQSGAAGDGDDFIQGGDSSISIYNNVFIGYNVSSYPRGQHQDGWQPLGGSYLKFYNNYCQDIGNYSLFGDGLFGAFDHFVAFNNIAVLTDPSAQSLNPQGLIIGSDGGYYSQNGNTWAHMVNCALLNNLCVDISPASDPTSRSAGHICNGNSSNGRDGMGHDTFTNCDGYNNIAVRCGSFFWNGDPVTAPSTLAADGVVNIGGNPSPLTDAQAAAVFKSFAANTASPPNDYHLLSGASSLRGQGVNLTSLVSSLGVSGPDWTKDKDGNPRPATGAWDIGPYQFAGTPPPPTVPNLIGLTQSAASSAITAAGFVVGTVSSGYSISVVAGQVYLQSPAAGATATQGSAVNFTVSLGPPPVTVPNVVGMTQSNAGATIAGANLTVGTTTQQSSSTVPSGNVISQNPAAGSSVNSGSAVALVISSGPAPTSTNFLIAPTSGTFTSGSNVWSFGAPNGSNYTTLLNGSPAGTGSGVILINENGVIEVQTYVKNWYKWNGSTWVSIPGPTPYP